MPDRLLPLALRGQCQTEIAMTLRLLVGHLQHLPEHLHRERIGPGLHQPVAEHAQDVAVLQLEFGEVGG